LKRCSVNTMRTCSSTETVHSSGIRSRHATATGGGWGRGLSSLAWLWHILNISFCQQRKGNSGCSYLN
jgi:hypothetical protein